MRYISITSSAIGMVIMGGVLGDESLWDKIKNILR